MKNYEEFIDGLQQEVAVPQEILTKMQNTLSNLPESPTKKKIIFRGWVKAATATAALLALASGICFSNPVMAAKIPIIGKIFERVEENVTFSGTFDETKEVLTPDQSVGEELDYSAYTVEDQGIEITASEVYCDGYSVYLTAKIRVEAGGLTNIPEHYTGVYAEGNTVQGIYISGTWELQNENITPAIMLSTFEGDVLDDQTYIGMLKIDLEKVAKDENILNLQLTNIGYDDLTALDTDDISASHKFEGNWDLSIPYHVDTENIKEIIVDEKIEDGYCINKIFISPYQLVVFTDAPYTTLEEEGFTHENFEEMWGEKNKQMEADGVNPVTYEECLQEKQYEYTEVGVFNQNGEFLLPQEMDHAKSVFATKGLEISKLHIFIGNEFASMIKTTDIENAKENAIMSTEIEIK